MDSRNGTRWVWLAIWAFLWLAALGSGSRAAETKKRLPDKPPVTIQGDLTKIDLLLTSAKNTRNSEGDFLLLKDGRIALFYLVKNSGADCRQIGVP